MSDFYQLSAIDASGTTIPFSQFKGHVCIVVNTATNCGLKESSYTSLGALAEKYPEIRVLAFPCNQFMGQEPNTACQVKDLMNQYSDKFTVFEKIDVNGENRHPVYKFLIKEQSGFLGGRIKWNFTKFLIDKNGNVIYRYGPLETIKEDNKYFQKALSD